jgi:adenine-specific DNA-methyltransferase
LCAPLFIDISHVSSMKDPAPLSPTAFARRLRRESTDAERQLWRHLRNRAVLGLKFRRQHAIPPFFLDFACPEIALVIEIDGGQHMSEEALASDARRTAFLEAQGYSVLRFSNIDVLTNIEGVVLAIEAAVEGRGR